MLYSRKTFPTSASIAAENNPPESAAAPLKFGGYACGRCFSHESWRRARLHFPHKFIIAVPSYAVILEPDLEVGGYTALVPALPGVVSEGDSVSSALENVADAIRLCLEDLQAHGEAIPASDVGARLERVEVSLSA